MDTFLTLWEITFPMVIMGIISYIIFALVMYEYLLVGDFRRGFKKGGIFKKLGHILIFILYLPIYILLYIFGIY